MNRIAIYALMACAAALTAQTPAPKPAAKSSKPAKPAAAKQAPLPTTSTQQMGSMTPPPIPKDAVAVLNGRGFTKREIEELIKILVPAQQQASMMADPKYFLTELGRLQVVAADALANKLNEKTPYKERYYVSNLKELSSMQYDDLAAQSIVTPEQSRQYYEKNIAKWQGVKIRAIYLPFAPGTSTPAPNQLKEDDAKALAGKIVAQARSGTDFKQLVKEHSRDEITKKNDGDFGLVRQSENLPDELKKVIFALKANQVSDPVRQSNGYYIFQVYEIVSEPFEKVQEQVFKEIKDLVFQKYVEDTAARIQLKILDEEFFRPKAPATGQNTSPQPATVK